MNFTVRLEPADYRAASRLVDGPRAARIWLGVLLLVLGLATWDAFYGKPQRAAATLVTLATFGLIQFLFQIWERIGPDRNREAVPTHVHVGPGGIHSRTELSTSRVPWSHFREWRENERVFVLSQKDDGYTVLSKKDVGAVAEQAALRNILLTRLGTPGKAKGGASDKTRRGVGTGVPAPDPASARVAGPANGYTYRTDARIDPEQLAGVFRASGIRRPVDDLPRLEAMLRHASLVITAWHGETLVSVARALTDHSYCCYLSDLAVDRAHQRAGIGRELVRRTREAIGEQCTLLLVSAPEAMDYYPRLGMIPAERAWIIDRTR